MTIYSFAISGFLVGLGVKIGNGCMSGHGVCGLPRLSIRSWVYISMAFIIAMATANVFHRIDGVKPNHNKNNMLTEFPLIVIEILMFIYGFILILFIVYLLFKKDKKNLLTFLVYFFVSSVFALGLIISGFIKR